MKFNLIMELSMRKLNICCLAGMLLSAVLWSACSDDKENEQQPPAPSVAFTDNSSPVFEAAGGEAVIRFTANTGWTAQTDQEWCSVSPSQGDASVSTLTLSVAVNDTPDERNATLILKAGTATARLTFSQKQKDALTVTSNRIEVGSEGGTATVEVMANVAFEYTIDEKAAAWLTPVQTRALTATRLQFSVAANESSEKREGKIVIHSGELSETVTVYQEGEVPGLTLTQDEYTVGSEGEVISVELRSNVPYEMRLVDDVGWISEVATRSFSTYTRRFKVEPNEGYDYRTARIAFFNRELSLADTVTVTQVQKDAILIAQSEYAVEAAGGSLDFAVNANVDFQVELSAEWIKRSASTRGLVEVPLSFTVEANPGTGEREAFIILRAGQVEQSIRVLQAGQTPSVLRLTHTNLLFSVPLFSGAGFSGGNIAWGDGKEEAYRSEAKHTYVNEGPHTVSIEVPGAEEVTLPNLTGITDLDLTDF